MAGSRKGEEGDVSEVQKERPAWQGRDEVWRRRGGEGEAGLLAGRARVLQAATSEQTRRRRRGGMNEGKTARFSHVFVREACVFHCVRLSRLPCLALSRIVCACRLAASPADVPRLASPVSLLLFRKAMIMHARISSNVIKQHRGKISTHSISLCPSSIRSGISFGSLTPSKIFLTAVKSGNSLSRPSFFKNA